MRVIITSYLGNFAISAGELNSLKKIIKEAR